MFMTPIAAMGEAIGASWRTSWLTRRTRMRAGERREAVRSKSAARGAWGRIASIVRFLG